MLFNISMLFHKVLKREGKPLFKKNKTTNGEGVSVGLHVATKNLGTFEVQITTSKLKNHNVLPLFLAKITTWPVFYRK